MNEFKDSEEWKCLNNIWKKMPVDAREECYKDFQMISEKLKAIWEMNNLAENTEEANDFRYIDELSLEARKLFFYALDERKINLYHSAMAVIHGHGLNGVGEAFEYYMKRYASKRPYIKEKSEEMKEIVTLCYKRLEERETSAVET